MFIIIMKGYSVTAAVAVVMAVCQTVNGSPMPTKSSEDATPTSTFVFPTNAKETESALSALWSGITVSTAAITTTVSPTPIATPLIAPPEMPTFNLDYKLPPDFIWGACSAAEQVEGAVKADGRGPSVWDTLSHKVNDFIYDNEYPDVSDNNYYLYKQDIQRLKALEIPYYSFTISWSRILPFGRGGVNEKGLQHYIDIVDELNSNGIKPIVTLFHWDTPQGLQNAYGGWLGSDIVDDFATYAEIVFDALAAKGVKNWVTLNEPAVFCDDYSGWNYTYIPAFGVPLEERQWVCGHNALLAHATAVDIYRTKIEPKYGKGEITFKANFGYTPPMTNSTADADASERGKAFGPGWFLNPVWINGDYPEIMKSTLGSSLPEFTEEQKKLILGSADVLAWDAYTGNPVSAPPGGIDACVANKSSPYWPSCIVNDMTIQGNWSIGAFPDPCSSSWLRATPDIVRQGLLWLWQFYKPPSVRITEYGWSVYLESGMSMQQAVTDTDRVSYYLGYFNAILESINVDKVNLDGALHWGVYDNFEWQCGLNTRFGIQYVNFSSPTLDRYYKKSAFVIRDFFKHYVSM
ncbi:glycoside hydrolase superfamily [Umbelopsis sp. PMI_123]|nr:glycoside hydrolase superfamily [Umbelopsis sp. PMI_123]